MKAASIKIPPRGGLAGRNLALKIQERNNPSFVHNPNVGRSAYVVERKDGQPLTVYREDFDTIAATGLGLAWGALPVLLVNGAVKTHTDEVLVIEAMEVKQDGR